MKRYLVILAAAALLAGAAACEKEEQVDDPAYKGLSQLSFTEFTGTMANPERGFYSSSLGRITTKSLPPKAALYNSSRRTGKTIAIFEVELDDFLTSDITPEYLTLLQQEFDVLRQGGSKCILRFGYSWDTRPADGGTLSNGTPYDATPAQVLRHVEQMAPVLQENSDVIMVMQAGFVGAWGEWYYTDNFESANSTEFTGRKQLVEALLAALPANRQVQLRVASYKTRILGINPTDTLTEATAFKETPNARLGFHNDCFLASQDDQGTWSGMREKEYMRRTGAYTFMGGETCAKTNLTTCTNTLKEMQAQHWTYVHDSYMEGVISQWHKEGCWDEIGRRLGYRLVLKKAYVTKSVSKGGDVRVAMKIVNDGFAPPINPRGAEIRLVASDGTSTLVPLDVDPRYWKSGAEQTVDISFKAPEKAGKYDVCLNLPDPEPRLYGVPSYSIRLANENVWQEDTGYNKIYTLTVK